MFKKGICISALYKKTMTCFEKLSNAIKKVATSDTFNCVEFYFKGTRKEYHDIGNLIKETNLYAVFLAGFEMKKDCIDLGSHDNQKRKQAIEKCKSFVDVAYMLNAKKMLILSGPKPQNEDNKYAVADNFIKSMEMLLDYAKKYENKYSLDISLEFFNDDGEPYLAIGGIDIVEYICQKLCYNQSNFSITYDTSHVKQLGGDVFDCFSRLKQYVRHIHLANCVTLYPESNLFGDKHPLFNIEKGDFTDEDMIAFIKYLKKEDLLNNIDVCSFEVIAPSNNQADLYYQEIVKSAFKIFT